MLRSNEAILSRRFRALEESESSLRREWRRLREELARAEAAFTERVGELRRWGWIPSTIPSCMYLLQGILRISHTLSTLRYKDKASFKLDLLQRQLDETVPSSEMEAAKREFEELTAKHRELLQVGSAAG